MEDAKPLGQSQRCSKPASFRPVATFEDGSRRCTAWSRTACRQCTQRPVSGRTKCRWHGGRSPGRPPKLGTFSLPERYSEIESQLAEVNLFDLSAEMAVVISRIEELLNDSDGRDPAPDGEAFRKGLAELRRAVGYGARGQALGACDRLDKLLNDAKVDSQVWAEIRDLLRISERLSVAERGMSIKLETMLSLADVSQLVDQVVRIINTEVRRALLEKDREPLLKAIGVQMRQLYSAIPVEAKPRRLPRRAENTTQS